MSGLKAQIAEKTGRGGDRKSTAYRENQLL